jgi:ATP-binding cassette, subfamily C (CFTR/MRP), member 1
MAMIDSLMVCFERCSNMCKIPQEAVQRRPVPANAYGEQWVYDGKIKFIDFSVRYRPETEIILKKLNFTIQPKEKVGVVGRTGAGKSTI